jgi:hypothetical protein
MRISAKLPIFSRFLRLPILLLLLLPLSLLFLLLLLLPLLLLQIVLNEWTQNKDRHNRPLIKCYQGCSSFVICRCQWLISYLFISVFFRHHLTISISNLSWCSVDRYQLLPDINSWLSHPGSLEWCLLLLLQWLLAMFINSDLKHNCYQNSWLSQSDGLGCVPSNQINVKVAPMVLLDDT